MLAFLCTKTQDNSIHLSRKFTILRTSECIMEVVQDLIRKKIEQLPAGSILFPADFLQLGSYEAVIKSLARLKEDDLIINLAKGIYLKPAKSPLIGIIYPTLEQIANAIAERDKATLIPTGSVALNKLGLSTQVPLKAVYLTNGSPRTIIIGNRQLKLKKTSPKILAIKNELIQLVVQAMLALGKGNINETELTKIKEHISTLPEKTVHKELALAPIWIQKLLITKQPALYGMAPVK